MTPRPLLLALVLVLSSPCFSQQVADAPQPHRFQLVECSEDEVLVLDRRSGVLFAANLRLRTALMIDASRGQAISRPLEELQQASTQGAEPAWPTRAQLDARGQALRFEAVADQTSAVFDTATGRLYTLAGPFDMRVVDPVAGSLTRLEVAFVQRFPALTEPQQAAVRCLRALPAAQRAFRARGAGSFGDDRALAQAQLLPELPAAQGYTLAVWASRAAPSERWIAVATPAGIGPRFLINHLGVVHRCDAPFEVDPDSCSVPDAALPLE